MPDAREVVFTPAAGLQLTVTWDSSIVYPVEHADDQAQIMIISKSGDTGLWMPKLAVVPGPFVLRSDGTLTLTVPKDVVDSSTHQIYCVIKFKAGSEMAGRIKGVFRFPVGITPITLIP